MESWEELMAKGTSGPGSQMSVDKAAKKIHEAKSKEDPQKVPYHPGVERVSIDKEGNLDMKTFNHEQSRKNPMVGDMSALLKNKDVQEFMAAAQQEKKAEENKKKEAQPTERGVMGNTTTKDEPDEVLDEEDESIPLEVRYSNRLKRAKISEEHALEILDSLFSDKGYYEEEKSLGKLKFKLRTARGEAVSYMFTRLNQFKQWDVLSRSYTEEYVYHKNLYRLSLLL